MKIPFLSLDFQNNLFREKILSSIERVYDSNNYVLGQNVTNFEKEYSSLNSVKYTIGVGSGLDALFISLKAIGIKKGDEIIVPSNTYIATWLSISNTGAKIVPVEPRIDTYNIDESLIEQKITHNTKAIMPVHLYGHPSEMDKIMRIAKKYNLFVIEDNAQAQLATFKEKFTGTFGHINATSFYPTKNIGAIGEAGAITTDLKKYERFSRLFRNYGSEKTYHNIIIGMNSRIDELQASILNVKLGYINFLNNLRIKSAQSYNNNLEGIKNIIVPFKSKDCKHVYHLYVIRSNARDKLKKYLSENGIGSSIHYPIPPHLQKAYQTLGFNKGNFPIAEELAKTSLSLPIYPGLKENEITYICEKINDFVKI